MAVLLWLVAAITGGRIVYLKDMHGVTYRTIAYRDEFGGVWCHVYPIVCVGHCVLLPDGTVHPRSQSCYVERWTFGRALGSAAGRGSE